MSDRCYFEIVVRKTDLGRVERILGHSFGDMLDDAGVPKGLVTAIDLESSGGYLKERRSLGESGVAYWGHHSCGDGYGAHIFAGVKGHGSQARTDHTGQPMVRVGRGGRVAVGDLRQAQDYLRTVRRAKKEMTGPAGVGSTGSRVKRSGGNAWGRKERPRVGG